MNLSDEPLDMISRPDSHRLPIFPLSDEVHFPQTQLRLRVVEPEYCDLAQEIYAAGIGHIGTVLLRPDGNDADPRLQPVFAAGTAARLIEVEAVDGGCDVVLQGEYRFELEKELAGASYREALVRLVSEPQLSEFDPDVQSMRQEIIDRIWNLAEQLGERFDLDHGELVQLGSDLSFEAMVNHLSANMDMTPTRKLQLLRRPVQDRALHLLTILRSREQVLDVLRPFRHLAASAEIN